MFPVEYILVLEPIYFTFIVPILVTRGTCQSLSQFSAFVAVLFGVMFSRMDEKRCKLFHIG